MSGDGGRYARGRLAEAHDRPARSAPTHGTALVGRRAELARIQELLRSDGGGALVCIGEPGIGKSALLQAAAAAAQAQGRMVLRAGGVESEACVPFSSLHQLLQPVLRSGPALRSQQRAVLDAALGLTAGSGADVFQTALATLELLSEIGADQPVLAIVEDAHWIDPATAGVLAFVGRRLAVEPVALLVAMRPADAHPLQGLPILPVEALRRDDATRLVDRAGLVNRQHRERILHEADGNPLALLELPLSLMNGDWAADGPALPLTARLAKAFTRRLDGLSPDARTALLVMAAHDSGDLHEVVAAVRELTGAQPGPDLYAPMVDRGLLMITDGQARFGHPLVRSATYQSSPAAQRSAAHRALAAVLVAEPDRRAWHLAAAAVGTDPVAADEVAAAAERAQERGATSVVAYAFERAAGLTPPGPLHRRRLLRAAEVALELGDAARAGRLLDRGAALVTAPLEKCRATLVEEGAQLAGEGGAVRIHRLCTLATTARDAGDVDLAVRLLHAAALRVWSSEWGDEAREIVVRSVLDLPLAHSDHRVLAVLGLADPRSHGPAIEEGLRRLVRRPATESALGLVTSPYLVAADRNLAALQVGELDRLRRDGRLRMIPLLSAHHGWTEVCLARWSNAAVAAGEGVRVAEELGQPVWAASNMITQAMLATVSGDDETSSALTDRAESILLPLGAGASLCGIQLTRTVNALAAGRYGEAYAHSRRVLDSTDPAHHRVQSGWLLGDFATAALHCGRVPEAREILARYDEPGAAPPSPWTAMAIEFARPLLADDDHAEALFTAALAGRVAAWPAYRARLQLEYGVWMRRHRRVAESRHPLRAAREACDALGLKPWAERARAELRASGESSAPGRTPPWARLSPQELQIAQLAAAGLSNREIGLKLFLSHRTVASHLYRIFPKFGITGRSQLRDLLDGPTPG